MKIKKTSFSYNFKIWPVKPWSPQGFEKWRLYQRESTALGIVQVEGQKVNLLYSVYGSPVNNSPHRADGHHESTADAFRPVGAH